jgi:AraC family transcriptional regulator
MNVRHAFHEPATRRWPCYGLEIMPVELDEARFEWPQITVRSARDPVEREPFRITSRPLHHVWLLVAGAPTILRRAAGQQRWTAARMTPGDINVCSAGEPDFDFGWTSDSGAAPPEFAQVFLDRTLVERVAREHGLRRGGLELTPRVGVRDPLIAEILHALRRCVRNPRQTDAMFVDAAAELLAVQLLRECGQERTPRRESRDRPLPAVTVARVREFVDGSLEHPLRVVELASVAGMSVHHFSRAFRMATGETPHGFTLRLRIERAEQLLRQGNLGLAEIAIATGFSSQSHFTTQYRLARGMTPGAFRRRYRP